MKNPVKLRKRKTVLPKSMPWTIPGSEKDVHTEHCCVRHGCKYGEDFFCTVVQKKKPQSFICEHCAHEGIIDLNQLDAVLSGKKPCCPYCKHTLP